jgi:SAM-dependent methyltransferase
MDISRDFDYIVNNTTDLEFYAHYHNIFVNSPLFKNFDENKTKYQKELYERKFKTIKNMINVVNKRMLDIGQEDYYYSELFNKNRSITKMEGINVSLTLNYKGDKSNIKIYDGYNIPYPNNTFDIVVMHMVLHHVIDHYEDLLKDIYRVLKSSGTLIIEDHDFVNEYTNDFIDVFHFLYEMVESTTFNIDYYNNYVIRRFRKEDLVKDLLSIGFKSYKIIMNNKHNPLAKYYLIVSK